MLFSDEPQFNLNQVDGCLRVYHRRDVCIVERDRFGAGPVLLLGGIMNDVTTRLIIINGSINADRYVNGDLATKVWSFIQCQGTNVLFIQRQGTNVPFIQRQGANVIFQHDDAQSIDS